MEPPNSNIQIISPVTSIHQDPKILAIPEAHETTTVNQIEPTTINHMEPATVNQMGSIRVDKMESTVVPVQLEQSPTFNSHVKLQLSSIYVCSISLSANT